MPRNLRLAASLVLLALPLAVAAWAFADAAGSHARTNADQSLSASTQSAVPEYRNLFRGVQNEARAIAGERRVQRALADRDRGFLDRLAARTPNIGFAPRGSKLPHRAGAASTVVSVQAGGRTIGRVVGYLPFDAHLLQQLDSAARLSHRQRLAFALDGRIGLGGAAGLIHPGEPENHAVDVEIDGKRYRAAAASLVSGAHPVELVALESADAIAGRAGAARLRVALAAAALIAAILTIAYAVAPGIARSRVARVQRDQAARVLSHLGDGVFLVDGAGVVQLWNAAAEAITGLEADRVCGSRAVDAIPGWSAIEKRIPVAALPGETDQPFQAEALPLTVKDNELWLSLIGVDFSDGVVYAFRDVTSERRLEQIRSEFVATVSHELRTPLASLHGAAVTLREHGKQLGPQTQGELFDVIADQSMRLARLVDEILLASQLDAGGLSVVSEPFDPEPLVRGAVEMARMHAARAPIEASIPPDVPKIDGDPGRTRQVLVNLIDNAIKYSSPKGRIEVLVEPRPEWVRFSVRDRGAGIPLSEQQRIFEKFYRLDPDQRRGVGGTGLGLYICRELVRSMGGRIWVESTPGEGATFCFELRVAEDGFPRRDRPLGSAAPDGGVAPSLVRRR